MIEIYFEQFKKFFLQDHQYFSLILAFLASLYVINIIQKIFKHFYEIFLQQGYDLSKRYGQGSWAVITGASEGIGKEFCIQLARKGFNIIMMARNQTKMQENAQYIENTFSVKTRIIQVDFSEDWIDEFYNFIYEQIRDLDISILVNNVGNGNAYKYENYTLEEITRQIKVNCFPQIFLTKKLINQMLERPLKSGIINISSIRGDREAPYVQIYAATKAFNDYFSRALNLETEQFQKIDVMSAKPGLVSTQMTGFPKSNLFLISNTNDCVSGILRKLGKTDLCYGYWKHEILGRFIFPNLSTKTIISKIKKSRIRPKNQNENQKKNE